MKIAASRRTFVQAIMAMLAGGGQLFAGSLRRLVPNRQEQRAAERGRQLGVGTVTLEGPQRVEVDTLQTWTLVYTVGEAGIKAGGGLRIGLRHLQNWHAELPQTQDPSGSGYLTARAGGGVPVEISIPKSSELNSQYFAWQNLVQALVGRPGLRPGEQLRITFGDRSGGSPGWRVQPFDEIDYGFKCYVDVSPRNGSGGRHSSDHRQQR